MKRRLSASIDEELLDAAEAAVRDGRAPSVSALVEEAITRQLEHTKRMQAMEHYVEAFEEEYGAFEPGEAERLSREFLAGARSARAILAEADAAAAAEVAAEAERHAA